MGSQGETAFFTIFFLLDEKLAQKPRRTQHLRMGIDRKMPSGRREQNFGNKKKARQKCSGPDCSGGHFIPKKRG